VSSLLVVRAIEEALRTAWETDADFVSRGTEIYAPRILDLDGREPREFVDFHVPRIEFVDTYSTSPRWDRRRATLRTLAVKEVRLPKESDTADPGTYALEQLAPLAELVERKIETTLRNLSNRSKFPVLAQYVETYEFGSYERAADTGGDLLRAQGIFETTILLLIPHEFDEDALLDLTGADVDYELAGDPELPSAEDTINL